MKKKLIIMITVILTVLLTVLAAFLIRARIKDDAPTDVQPEGSFYDENALPWDER